MPGLLASRQQFGPTCRQILRGLADFEKVGRIISRSEEGGRNSFQNPVNRNIVDAPSVELMATTGIRFHDPESSQAVPTSIRAPQSDHKASIKKGCIRQTVGSFKLSSLKSIYA